MWLLTECPSCGPCLPGTTTPKVDTMMIMYSVLALGCVDVLLHMVQGVNMVQLGLPDACSCSQRHHVLGFGILHGCPGFEICYICADQRIPSGSHQLSAVTARCR
jgi:hypothetical protein